MPAPDTPVGDGSLGYHIHTGAHTVLPYDWMQYIRFADRHFQRK